MTRDEFIFKKLWPDKCWHTAEWPLQNGYCDCGQFAINPDLSSKSGFFLLLKGMQEHERWEEFKVEHGALSKHGHHLDLLLEEIINPPVFADAVGKFFGWKEGK